MALASLKAMHLQVHDAAQHDSGMQGEKGPKMQTLGGQMTAAKQ